MSWIFGVNKEQAVPQNFEQIMNAGSASGGEVFYNRLFNKYIIIDIDFSISLLLIDYQLLHLL